MRTVTTVLVAAFAATLALDLPALPLNARLADVVFVALVAMVPSWGHRRWQWSPLDGLVVLSLLGTLPSFAVTDNRWASVVELLREGYLVAVYFVVALAARNGFARATAAGLAVGGAALAAIGLAVVAGHYFHPVSMTSIGEVMPLPYVGSVFRLKALTASESMLACFLGAAAPFALGLARDRAQGARGWLIAAGAMVAAALFTFSHSLAGLAVAATIGAWPLLRDRATLRRLLVVVSCAIVVGMNIAATVAIRRVTDGRGSLDDNTSYHHAVGSGRVSAGPFSVDYDIISYFRLKEIAWSAFVAHPLTGVGLDRFHLVTARAQDDGLLPALYRETDPHSTLLGRLAETGLPGGVTLVMLWFGIARLASASSGGTAGRRWVPWAATAAITGLIVSSPNVDMMNFRFFWVAVGLLRGTADPAVDRSTRIHGQVEPLEQAPEERVP